MSPIIALAWLDIAAAVLLAAIFGHGGIVGNERYLKRWASAWAFLAVSQALVANDLLGQPVPFVHVVLPVAGVATILMLVAGTNAFTGRSYSHAWTVAAVLGGVGVGVLESSFGVNPVLATMPAVLVLAVAILTTAVALARYRPGRGSYRFAAAAMMLWGLNMLTYPVLGQYEEAMPIGMGLSALFQIATGIGLLLSHLNRAREALVAATEQERELIEHAVVGVIRTDADGRFLQANPKLLEILGYDDFEALQREHRVPELAGKGPQYDLETLWRRRDGKPRRVHVSGRDVLSSDGELRYFEGFVTDVTDQQRLEEQLDTARRLQAVGSLTGGIAHDFNNLLTVIQGNLEMARLGHEEPLVTEALENQISDSVES